MTNSERRAWDRESLLEDVSLHGFASLSKTKYLALAGYVNWCGSANSVWLTDWRRITSKKNDLQVMVVGDVLFIIDPNSVAIDARKLSQYC